jgi:heptosyltransferase I
MTPQNILLIRLSSIGDVLHCTPVAKTLRERFPHAKISWIVGEKSKDILLGNPYLDQILIWQREKWESELHSGAWRKGYENFRVLEHHLRQEQFDVAIDMHGLLLSGLIGWRSGAATRIGFSNAREGSPLFYTDKVSPMKALPITRHYLQLLKSLDVRKFSTDMVMPIAEEDAAFAQYIWKDNQLSNSDVVVILNPATSWITKNWPPEYYAVLANLLMKNHKAKIILLGAPSDMQLVNNIMNGISEPVINLAGRTNLKELAAVVQNSNLFIGGDTGPLHVAAAVGTPTISIFGPTDPRVYTPEGEGHIALTSSAACKGCHNRRCKNHICMTKILPIDVYRAAEKLLTQCSRKQRNLEAVIYGQVPTKTIYTSI